ncbi:MAG: hypothetical protein KDD51_15690 [Bdellovibrionales bacterium]|nr:hypothetical protein [Bdellovibrionales bacterium]
MPLKAQNKRCLRLVVFGVGLTTATFLVAEAGVRFYFFALQGTTRVVDNRARVLFLGAGVPFYASGPDKIRTHFGEEFALKKKPGTYRIVSFGGSTIENYSLFQTAGKTFATSLDHVLKTSSTQPTEILNVGFAGYTTAHSLILLNLHVQSWEPDLLLYSHNFNDLTVMYYPNLVPDYSNMLSLPYFSQARHPNPLASFLQRFRLTEGLARKLPTPIHYSAQTSFPYETAQQLYRRNIESFLTIAKKNRIKTVLVTESILNNPSRFEATMKAQPYAEAATFPPYEKLVEHHRWFNNILKEYADPGSVYVLDAASSLEEHPEYFSDFIHFNKEGLDAFAEMVGNYLAQHGLNKSDPTSKSKTKLRTARLKP